jgi:thiamine biosynthesis lipoprotein
MMSMGCKPRYAPVRTIETHFLNTPVLVKLAVESKEELQIAASLAIAEVRRLEELFNPMNTEGGLYRLNESRTLTDPELCPILERAQEISLLTGGRLNLFMGYLEQAYGFDRLFPQPPDPNTVREMTLALQRASMQFNPEGQQVRIPSDAFSVSLTGVQEGYVADQALAHVSIAGIQNAMVEVGWHRACGGSSDGLGWPIEITHPAIEDTVIRLFVEHRGVATASILDEAYTFRDEVYFNHLDPSTGRPARRLSSVTVVAPSCELAGALAQGIFVMEPEEGLRLLNDLPEVEGMLLDTEGRIAFSDSLFMWMDN